MGKIKRPRLPKAKKVSVLGSDDEDLYRDMEQADPKSREYIYNEIDEFNDDRERIPLESDDEDHLTFKTSKEEVLALPDDSDDDSETDAQYNNDFYSRMTQKDEIASDIDDNEEDNLPNEKAWGKKKSSYYNTDYVDKDYDGFQGSDTELAEAEEKEATRIQKRLLQELSEEDFGLDWITPTAVSTVPGVDLNKETVATDLSALTDSEKLEFLKKESPELLYLVKDFELRMTELKDKILPLIPLVEDGRIPPGLGANYLTAKRKLVYLYCMNITFYLMIRCKDVNVKHHPVMKRLSTFRKLLDQLDPMSKILEKDIEAILKMLTEGGVKSPDGTRPQNGKENGTRRQKSKKRAQKKTVSFVEEQETVPKEAAPKKRRKTREETADEKEALEMYELMKNKNRKKTAKVSSDDNSEGEEEMLDDTSFVARSEEDEGTSEKREISYQIAKNKGLTPHRKKEYRNPRVRHRVKFQKAKVRRKGQFKEPRKELQRYGGEISGIRIGSKRGIKLK